MGAETEEGAAAEQGGLVRAEERTAPLLLPLLPQFPWPPRKLANTRERRPRQCPAASARRSDFASSLSRLKRWRPGPAAASAAAADDDDDADAGWLQAKGL